MRNDLIAKTAKKLLPEDSPGHILASLISDLKMLPFDDLFYLGSIGVPLDKKTEETLRTKVGNAWLNRFKNRHKLAVILARAKEVGGFERLEHKYFSIEL